MTTTTTVTTTTATTTTTTITTTTLTTTTTTTVTTTTTTTTTSAAEPTPCDGEPCGSGNACLVGSLQGEPVALCLCAAQSDGGGPQAVYIGSCPTTSTTTTTVTTTTVTTTTTLPRCNAAALNDLYTIRVRCGGKSSDGTVAFGTECTLFCDDNAQLVNNGTIRCNASGILEPIDGRETYCSPFVSYLEGTTAPTEYYYSGAWGDPPMSWADAKSFCRAMGAELAAPQGFGQNNFVQFLAPSPSMFSTSRWTGFKRTGDREVFRERGPAKRIATLPDAERYVGCNPDVDCLWAGGNPAAADAVPEQDCVAIGPTPNGTNNHAVWRTFPCSSAFDFVCERPMV